MIITIDPSGGQQRTFVLSVGGVGYNHTIDIIGSSTGMTAYDIVINLIPDGQVAVALNWPSFVWWPEDVEGSPDVFSSFDTDLTPGHVKVTLVTFNGGTDWYASWDVYTPPSTGGG